MRVGLYCRVSTDEQATHGFSIDNQKERLIAFCASQGWGEYTLYVDDGYTGTKLDRPAMKRMRRHVEEGKLDMIVVYKLDRLGRKQLDVLHLLDFFEQFNVAFKSATEPFDTSTPLGKAMIGILAVFAQLERDMIIERTTSGRRQRVSSGLWYGGRPPFGYSWTKETESLEILEDEAYVVKEIFDQYLQGKSRLAISDWAASQTNARVFDHSVIRDILARPVYIGKLVNNGSLVEGRHKAIIDDETFYKVQIESARRKEGMSPIGEYLLTGLLKCGVCGAGVVHVIRTTNKNSKTYSYELYACKNQHVRAKDRGNNCSLGYRRRELVEAHVVEQMKALPNNQSDFKKAMSKNVEERFSDEVVKALREKLHIATVGLENLYDAVQNGDIKMSFVVDRIKNLEASREMIEKQLEDIKDETPKYLEPENFYLMINEVGELWDHCTYDERKMLIRKVVKHVTLKPDSVLDIEWNTVQ
jgi:site-specific DNA recombinase